MMLCLLFALFQAPPITLTKRVQLAEDPAMLLPVSGADVVVFFLDDVGARDVELISAGGRLPTFDALAADGVTFENGYAQPMCAPSRWSIMLSEWQGGHAGFSCHPNVDGTSPGPSSETHPLGQNSLPRALEGAGYSTAYFGRWGNGTWPGDDAGTQEYAWTPMLWGFETWRAGIPDGVDACGGTGYDDWVRVDDGDVSTSADYATTAVQDAFLAWWTTTPSPKFAFVSFPSAHSPFHYPPVEAMPPGWVQPLPPHSNRKKFEEQVVSLDVAIANCMAEVSLENTLVFLIGDNGTPSTVPPSGYTSGKVKFSTYEGGVRVPFVAAGLGFDEGVTSAQPVSIVDLIPTLEDLAGVCTGGFWDGQSILPALDGDQPLTRGWVYVQSADPLDSAVIEEQWKLRLEEDGDEWLYDLTADPFELSPIDADTLGYETIAARLRAELAEAQQ